MNPSRFLYVHDPMCSWCWGHRPVWDELERQLSEWLPIQYVVGGLAPDSDVPMPEAQQNAIQGYWRRIEELLGAQFNYDFWTKNTPRRSTYLACRATIAARWQSRERDMISAIQEAYYLRAMNPSDLETHAQLAQELGLDVEKFNTDMQSPAMAETFEQELAFAHRLPIQGFPSMVLLHEEKAYALPLDYKQNDGVLGYVQDILGK